MKKIDKIERYFVSKLLPVFLYWMKLRMIKPIDVIKKYIGSITPSIEPIFNTFVIIFLTLTLIYYIKLLIFNIY